MPHITRQLLRRRAEHNEGILSTLEEISLHQEEIEAINEVLGMTCRKLKILYLQNNIIPKMENLHHMKDLQYLNLALNNISKIEGLNQCEFLNKLDLTVNFIDFDTLEESINNLATRVTLRDLYLMGNPAQVHWDHFNDYVIAKLPQLERLDGTDITRSMQIKARQNLTQLEGELRTLAEEAMKKKQAKLAAKKAKKTSSASASNRTVASTGAVVEDVDDDDVQEGRVNEDDEDDPNRMTENTPEERVKIYQELAQQKREKEEKEKANAPKERDYDAEHAESVQSVRKKESELPDMEIRQKNEGGWDFAWDEDSKPGHVILEVHTPRFLDSSLIDVDIHPTYVSVIIKSKVLRLRLPAEVHVSTSKCQRSKTTGHLSVIMPKVNPRETAVTMKIDPKQLRQSAARNNSNNSNNAGASRVKTTSNKMPSLHELMMADLSAAEKIEQQVSHSSTVSSGGLLDAQVGNKRQSNTSVDVTKICPQQKQEDSHGTVSTETIFDQRISKVSEISPVSPLIAEMDMTALD